MSNSGTNSHHLNSKKQFLLGLHCRPLSTSLLFELEIQENKEQRHNYTFFLENTNYNLRTKLVDIPNDQLIGSIMNLNHESIDMINIHNMISIY